MYELTEEKVNALYLKFKSRAKTYIGKKKLDEAIPYIEAAAYTAYTFGLGFVDDDIEEFLKECANYLIRTEDVYYDANACVFYDFYSKDNAGLTQQYVRAILNAGYKLTYITERNDFMSSPSGIKRLLDSYNRTTVIELPSGVKGMARAQYLYDAIVGAHASKLFIHSNPRVVHANIAFSVLPPQIERYKINLTDHAFWIGSSCLDYTLEFANYGCNLSHYYRRIPKHNILHLPFYPIMDNSEFLGFPDECRGKFVVFSGGAFYKIFDKKDDYFKLCRAICDVSPDIVILFAGENNKTVIEEKIKRHKLTGRFFLLGYRQDITACFENCDVYLNTYPIGGGLMTQYAAQKGKPVLSFHDGKRRKVEEYTCQKGVIQISSNSFEEIQTKIGKMLHDKNYYDRLSEEIRSCVICPEEFDQYFQRALVQKQTPVHINWANGFKPIPFDLKDKLTYENKNHNFQLITSKIFGKQSWRVCPSCLILAFITIVSEGRLFSFFRNHKG